MKSLFSATAALALLVAAGQAGAQTTADQPGAATTSQTAPMSSDASADKTAAPAAKQHAWTDSSMRYGRDAAANRREAKITNQLNQQELAKVDNAGSASGAMSGASSQTQMKNGDNNAAGSGSSLGLTSSPSAGSDTISGSTSAPRSNDATGDKPAQPDSSSPQSNPAYSTPANGQSDSGH